MSGQLPSVTARDVLRALARDGWVEQWTSGSHVILAHPPRVGRPVVPKHAGVTIKDGTLHRILIDAGLTREQFRALI